MSLIGRKRWLTYFFPWATIVLLLAAYFNHAETQRELDRLKTLDIAATRLGVENLESSIRQVGSDIFLLASYADLADAINRPEPAAMTRLTRELTNFARAHRKYDQIRWIDETGQERVRINAGPRGAVAVPRAELQNKSDRYYFSATLGLKPGEIYVSPLDLNVERGAVEMPHKPTIRFATPLHDSSGRSRGILIVNYLAEDMLERFRMVIERVEARSVLVNAEAYWLTSDQREDEWGFMFGRKDSFALRSPAAWAVIRTGSDGQFEDAQGLWTYGTVHPVVEGGKSALPAPLGFAPSRNADEERRYRWKVVTLRPLSELQAVHLRRLPQTLAVAAVALLIMLFGSWRLAAARALKTRADAALRQSNVDLERTVQMRTRELRSENADRQLAERRYRESSEQYQHILAAMHDGYWLCDANGGVLDVNPAACAMLGYRHDELINMYLHDIVAAEPATVAAQLARLRETGHDRFEAQYRQRDGASIEVEVSAAYLPDYDRCVGLVRDISERRKSEGERRLAALVLDNTDEAVVVCDADLHIMKVNPAFTRITGYAPEEVLGQLPTRLAVKSGAMILEVFLADLMHRLHSTGSWRGEISSRRKSGELYPIWLNVSVVRSQKGEIECYVGVFSDITPIKESQARISFLAHHDALTGLPNRLLFHARLEHSLERVRRDGRGLAVLFVDLDHFKSVNDTLGHAAGDKLLKELATAMGDCLRGEDTLARLGGDEFVILLEDIGDRAAVELVVEKIERVFPCRVPAGEQTIDVTASIGIALYPVDGRDGEPLVQQADRAMYAAKEGGRNRHFYAADVRVQPASKAP